MLLIEPHGLTSINTGFSEAIDSARASGSMAPRLQNPPKYRKDQCQSAGVFFVLYIYKLFPKYDIQMYATSWQMLGAGSYLHVPLQV